MPEIKKPFSREQYSSLSVLEGGKLSIQPWTKGLVRISSPKVDIGP